MKPEEKRAYYEQHVSAWQNSGLTQKTYCQQANIGYGGFKNWRKHLSASQDKAPEFIAVESSGVSSTTDNALVLQVSLSNGTRIGVSRQASEMVIEQVLKLAGGLL